MCRRYSSTYKPLVNAQARRPACQSSSVDSTNQGQVLGISVGCPFIWLTQLNCMCLENLIRILVYWAYASHAPTTTLLLGLTDDAEFFAHFP